MSKNPPEKKKDFTDATEEAGLVVATTRLMRERKQEYNKLKREISVDVWRSETEIVVAGIIKKKIITLGPFAVFKNMEAKYYQVVGTVRNEVFPYLTALNYDAGGSFIRALERRAALFENLLLLHRGILRKKFVQIKQLRRLEKQRRAKVGNSIVIYDSCWKNVKYIYKTFILHVASWFLTAAGLAWKQEYIVPEKVIAIRTIPQPKGGYSATTMTKPEDYDQSITDETAADEQNWGNPQHATET